MPARAAAAGRGGASGAGGAAGRRWHDGRRRRGGRGGGSGTGSGGTAGSSSVDGGNWDAPPLGSTVTIHVAGDSTAAIFPASDATMRVGWAAVLDPLFDSTVTVDDAALSGRSTKSYIDEGAWSTLQAKIKTGDYLFIEFGHNDEKTDDPTRYTDPATTYRDNLRTFINGARARGGVPVLLTSICRRQFSGNTVTGTHGAYTTAVFAVGQETGMPVLDMETRTKNWLMGARPDRLGRDVRDGRQHAPDHAGRRRGRQAGRRRHPRARPAARGARAALTGAAAAGRQRRVQCQLLIWGSAGLGVPLPVSTSAFRLIRKTAHFVEQWFMNSTGSFQSACLKSTIE